MNKRILLTGASGYVGARIYKDIKSTGYDIKGLYHNNKIFDDLVKVDIKNYKDVEDIMNSVKPKILIHCAADAHTNTCEQDPNNAYELNVEATRKVVEIAKTQKIRVIYISTFACFKPNPSNVYAKTKVAAENLVKELKDYVILRLSMVTGLSPNTSSQNFYNDLIKAYKTKLAIDADSDWKFEMTYLGHVSEVVERTINMPTINNVVIPVIEQGVTSKYEIALDLFKGFDVDINETKSGRIIPLVEIDSEVYSKFNLIKHNYKESIKLMRKELESINE